MLTLYHKIPKTLRKTAFENIMQRGENAGKQLFFLFPQCFLPITNFAMLATFKLLSANALNLEKYNSLSFDKELTLY